MSALSGLRHLLDIESLSRDQILAIVALAKRFEGATPAELKRWAPLFGKTVVNLFMEPSTRTRVSFELAAKRLSADAVHIGASGSSVTKGETLLDTVKTLDAMGADIIVLRHASSGAPQFVAERVRCSVVNAGDGAHEHPTQALLDAATMMHHKGELGGRIVTIVGDVAHSRVARSNMHLLAKLGARVRVVGPPTLMPIGVEAMGVERFERLEPALAGADVVMALRLQTERQEAGLIPSLQEYTRFFGIHAGNMKLAKPDAIVMHPGPIHRGVEIASDVADGPQSVVLEQVARGVGVRMAVLYLLAGGSPDPFAK